MGTKSGGGRWRARRGLSRVGVVDGGAMDGALADGAQRTQEDVASVAFEQDEKSAADRCARRRRNPFPSRQSVDG